MYQSRRYGHWVSSQGIPRWDRYEAYHPCVNPRNGSHKCLHYYDIGLYEQWSDEFQDVYDWIEEVKGVLRDNV